MKAHAKIKTHTSSRANATPVPNALAHRAQHRHVLRRAGIQPHLRIGAANDSLEREADAAAEHVLRMSEPETALPEGSRKEPKGLVQARAVAPPAAAQVSPEIETFLRSLNGSGTPMDAQSLAFFEPRFGHDFSRVRLHTGASAACMADALDAKAFTLGNNIAFAPGQYSAHTSAGRNLLGHELAHVVQQNGIQQQNMNADAPQAKWVQRKSNNSDEGWETEERRIVPLHIKTLGAFAAWAKDDGLLYIGPAVYRSDTETWEVKYYKRAAKGEGGEVLLSEADAELQSAYLREAMASPSSGEKEEQFEAESGEATLKGHGPSKEAPDAEKTSDLSENLNTVRNFVQRAADFVKGFKKVDPKVLKKFLNEALKQASKLRGVLQSLGKKFGKWMGPVGYAVDAIVAIIHIWEASPEERWKVALREVFAIVGGLIGGAAGVALAALLIAQLAITAKAAVVIVTVAIVVAIGWAASKLAGKLGELLYEQGEKAYQKGKEFYWRLEKEITEHILRSLSH